LPGLTMTSHVSFIRQSSMVIFAGHGLCCAARPSPATAFLNARADRSSRLRGRGVLVDG
jgi:hypothetical protein